MNLKNKLRISALFMLTTTVLILGLYTVLNKTILLNIDGKTVKIDTLSNTVESFLINENININKGCRINPSIDTKLKNNTEVTVINPFKVKITDGNKEMIYETNQATVEDVLKEYNIVLNNKDILNKKLNDRLKANDTIIITRVEEELYKIIKEIPFEIAYINDAKLLQGKIEKESIGEKGKLEITYKITYKNGKEINKEKISEEVIKEPIKEVIRKGNLKSASI